MNANDVQGLPWHVSALDAAAERLSAEPLSLTEQELLQATHWDLGEDARLREDRRFRPTPWGRWVLTRDFLANDAIHRELLAEQRSAIGMKAAFAQLGARLQRRCVFCPADSRFVIRGEDLCLTASQLSRQPAIEPAVGELEKYTTHLPLHTLKAAAASAPIGQWGPGAQEQAIETLGWLRVSLPGRRLNERMFVARIEGQSMDDGRSGLVDGGYAVFELWPAGSRQHQNVLVRGAFHDPETGSYAVKRYQADQRDDEGRHANITLVSLNPDKDRFPDIRLNPEDDDALAVVAKVVQALTPEDYARKPKVPRRSGRRQLEGRDGLTEQDERLRRRLAAFFDGESLDDENDGEEAPVDGWHARIVCLGADAGGPHLELGPLSGLPPFVKKLRVVGHQHWDGYLLAANARARVDRLLLHPGSGPWRCEAAGFEDESDLGLERLDTEALSETAVTVFRVDADGIGQRQAGTRLARGQCYRLLLPPDSGTECPGDALADGWRLWTLDLDATPNAATLRALESLGLDVNDHWPRMTWAITPPTAWRTTARGHAYPVFSNGDEIFVQVSGLSAAGDESPVMFLKGPGGTESLSLSSAESGLVSLGTPAPGRWACALLHPRTTVPAETLLFEVADDAVRRIDAAWSVAYAGHLPNLAITAPPGWPVTVIWQVLSRDVIATVHADADGSVDLVAVHEALADRARRARVADIVIDLGELGHRSIALDHRPATGDLIESLAALWKQRRAIVSARVGDWLPLRQEWFVPVTTLLGYTLEAMDAADMPATELSLASWRLLIDERRNQRIERSPARVLILSTSIDECLNAHQEWIDRTCDLADVRDAIITDGTRWTTHRVRNRLRRAVWDLSEIHDPDALSGMLADLAEGL